MQAEARRQHVTGPQGHSHDVQVAAFIPRTVPDVAQQSSGQGPIPFPLGQAWPRVKKRFLLALLQGWMKMAIYLVVESDLPPTLRAVGHSCQFCFTPHFFNGCSPRLRCMMNSWRGSFSSCALLRHKRVLVAAVHAFDWRLLVCVIG